VLYAELVWAGSYSYDGEDVSVHMKPLDGDGMGRFRAACSRMTSTAFS
jgi:hypothetical protein